MVGYPSANLMSRLQAWSLGERYYYIAFTVRLLAFVMAFVMALLLATQAGGCRV